ncbi:MAG TPA: hypothetical protein VNM16_10635 [Bacillota bacterium]|nr:hypothetical protein [Bacillota bacterium]
MRVRGAAVCRIPMGYMVATCDALSAIGPMPGDAVAAPWPVVGRFTARVALMGLISLGAEPALVTATATAEAAVAGVVEEAALAGLQAESVAWSSEHNMTAAQTAVGVTAVGLAPVLRLLRTGQGLAVLALGRPKVGAAVKVEDPEVADLPALHRVMACPSTLAATPAGSGGLVARAQCLAGEAGMRFIADFPDGWPATASAGPATSLVCVSSEPAAVGAAAGLPWAVIGRLVPC